VNLNAAARGAPGPPFGTGEEVAMGGWLERLAEQTTRWLGSNSGFAIAVLIVVAWGACGPFFHYSETWQLVINTGTTIVTFLVVFLLQRSQNKESRAIQLKLNEIVAALSGASNRLINAEQLSEAELDRLAQTYQKLVERGTLSGARNKHRAAADEDDERRSHGAPQARAGSRR
jgi:low affinity Fe/Cu permease